MGILGSGCSVHRVGWIESEGDASALVNAEGQREGLRLEGPSAPLRGLGGYLVVLDGRKSLGPIRVEQWRVLEGPNGLAVWAGPVQQLGAQIGIQDLASGALVWVDAAAAREMAGHLGGMVAAEGWVDGPQRIQVVAWQALD